MLVGQSGLSLSPMLLLGWRRRTTGLVQDVGGRHRLIGMPSAAKTEFFAVLNGCMVYAERVLQLARTAPDGGCVVLPVALLGDSEFVAVAEKSIGRANDREKPEPALFNTFTSYLAI